MITLPASPTPTGKADTRRFPGDTTVAVTFRLISPHERVVLTLNHGNRVGTLIGVLQNPGEGVIGWEGINGADGEPLPYSIENLNAVAEASPEFYKWFNTELAYIIKLATPSEDDTKKNETKPSDGSTD